MYLFTIEHFNQVNSILVELGPVLAEVVDSVSHM